MQPYPANAKKVFSGILHDVYQWEQELFDGSTATFEKIVRNTSSVGVIGVVDDKLLVLEEQQPGVAPFYGIACGRIDQNETFEDAAKRELYEETGYRATVIDFFLESFGHNKYYQHGKICIAKGLTNTGKQQLDLGGEKINVHLYSFEEFLNLARRNDFRTFPILKQHLYECLLDENKKEVFKGVLFS